jgi:hypothetical protein
MPPVSSSSMYVVRLTVASTASTDETASTGPMRPIIAPASSGSVASSPRIV